jgi:hypothetical protein
MMGGSKFLQGNGRYKLAPNSVVAQKNMELAMRKG